MAEAQTTTLRAHPSGNGGSYMTSFYKVSKLNINPFGAAKKVFSRHFRIN
jgi:hypothetical protein